MLEKFLIELPDQYKIWFRLDLHNESIEIRIDDISYTPTKHITRYMDISSGRPTEDDIVYMLKYMLGLITEPVSNYDSPISSNTNVKF